MARRFHDDDYDDRPHYDESSSARSILLVVVGLLAIIGLGGTAAVGLYFMRFEAAAQERAAAVQAAQAQAQANAAAAQVGGIVPDVAEAPDPFPTPNPPASEEFPTDLGPERDPERQGNWTILFRSDDPGYWDTPGNASNYALPLFRAPAGIRYLRLKRMDNGEAIIIPITPGRLRVPPKYAPGFPPPGGPPAGAAPMSLWMGTNAVENGARHLGVIDFGEPGAGPVAIEADDNPCTGSGFGHKRLAEGAGQRYAWKGQEIAKTVFEIAVTAAELADDEKGLLANSNPNP